VGITWNSSAGLELLLLTEVTRREGSSKSAGGGYLWKLTNIGLGDCSLN
jgi:hypothetical protein